MCIRDSNNIVEQLDELLDENRQKIAALLHAHKTTKPTWISLAQPIEDMNDNLEQFWSPISHLHAVADNEILRKVYEECIPKLTAYATELGQNQELCAAWKSLDVYKRQGIYVGDGRFVHAPSRGGVVRMDLLKDKYWQRSYLNAKRPLADFHGGGS